MGKESLRDAEAMLKVCEDNLNVAILRGASGEGLKAARAACEWQRRRVEAQRILAGEKNA